MRNNIFALVLVVAALVVFGTSSAFAGIIGGPDPIVPVIPDFESHSNVSFDDGSGCGWWSLAQYEGRATVNVGAYSTSRIIYLQSCLTVDKYDSSIFSFNVSIRTLNGESPTGRLNFSRYSWSGENNLSAQVHDVLQEVYAGWDENIQGPIYKQEMQGQLNADLNANVNINNIGDTFGRWTSEWYDSNGNMYFSQAGGEFMVYGYGCFVGDDPAAIGAQLVASGAASFGVVPEPMALSVLAVGAIGLIRRRHQRS